MEDLEGEPPEKPKKGLKFGQSLLWGSQFSAYAVDPRFDSEKTRGI